MRLLIVLQTLNHLAVFRDIIEFLEAEVLVGLTLKLFILN